MEPSHLPSLNDHDPDEPSSASSSDDEDYVPKEGECVEDTYNAQISVEELETIGVQPTSTAAAANDLGQGLKLRSRLVGDGSNGDGTAGVAEEVVGADETARKKKEAEAFFEQLMAEEGLDSGQPSGSTPEETRLPSVPSRNEPPRPYSGKQVELVEEIFEFAGEEVKVSRPANDSQGPSARKRPTTSTPSLGSTSAGGGLQSAIAQLSTKKKKLTVLEKSSLDWSAFVDEETGLDEELKRHAKSKDAYLPKRDFLDKADYSRYEKERDLRQRGRRH